MTPGQWFNLGVVAGGAISMSLVAFFMAFQDMEGFEKFLEKWQTLIGGIVALIGALAAAQAVYEQIKQARIQEAERLHRKHFGARAAMSVALSQIAQFAEEAMAMLWERRQAAAIEGEAAPVAINHHAPNLPVDALKTLRECIESAPERAMGDLAQVIRECQVIHARLRGRAIGPAMIVNPANIEMELCDVIELYNRCDAMFPWARHEVEDLVINIPGEELAQFARFRGMRSENLEAALRRRQIQSGR